MYNIYMQTIYYIRSVIYFCIARATRRLCLSARCASTAQAQCTAARPDAAFEKQATRYQDGPPAPT